MDKIDKLHDQLRQRREMVDRTEAAISDTLARQRKSRRARNAREAKREQGIIGRYILAVYGSALDNLSDTCRRDFVAQLSDPDRAFLRDRRGYDWLPPDLEDA